ncbi:MAG: InlB B-repeat-containing protein [Propionibacteriaceae bacterium]|nr:InlB B-repeat-containing protein [Propionibacteriaceae bacterium]
MSKDIKNSGVRRASITRITSGLVALGLVCGSLVAGASAAVGAPQDITDLVITVGTDSSSLNFTWFSDVSDSGTPVVEITGRTPVTGTQSAVSSNSAMNWNKVSVTGLAPATTYTFRVSSSGASFSSTYSVTTVGADSFRFAAVGDPQIGTTAPIDSDESIAGDSVSWTATAAEIAGRGAQFIVSTGDQIENAGQSDEAIEIKNKEYTGFLSGLTQSGTILPFAPAIGNHEADGGNPSGPGRALFSEHYTTPNQMTDVVNGFRMANYFYIVNDVLFVVLDTAPYPSDAAGAAGYIASYDKTLAAATTAYAGQFDWLVVQTHKSQLTNASHWSDTDIHAYSQAGFEDLMTKYGVDLAITGHDHSYSRTFPLTSNYTVVGTGGPMVADGFIADPANLGNDLVNPAGTVYMALNSATGSKYYAIHPPAKETSKIEYQTNVPQYTIIDVTQGKLAVATYEVAGGPLVDAYTIEKTVTITLDLNGGTSAVTALTIPMGATITWPADPTRPADAENTYSFKGWFTQANGGTAVATTTPVRGDATVYAQWTATPIGVFNPDPEPAEPKPSKELTVVAKTGGTTLQTSPAITGAAIIVLFLCGLGLLVIRKEMT